jgi:hypothetical protein
MCTSRKSALSLGVEPLEDRLVPTAGLSAALHNGVYTITDSRLHTSVLVGDFAKRIIVDGLPGSISDRRVGEIKIVTPAGNDTVRFIGSGAFPRMRDITVPEVINTGRGNDKLVGLNDLALIRDPQFTGGVFMDNASANLWQSTGGAGGVLGSPLGSEQPAGDGVGNITSFQNGAIYWTPDGGAYEVQGAIYATWNSLGGATSGLGAPVSNEQDANAGGGRISDFANGNIYWSDYMGTQVTYNSDPWAGLDNFVHTLSNQILASDVQNWTINDGGLTRGDVLNLLWVEESFGTVSGSDLADLQAIAANAQVENMPDYVANLLGKVVGDSPANASYQGNPLGDLYAGSDATQLADLTDKWFYGGDMPASAAGTTYVQAQGSLYGPGGVPQYSDVVQGGVGDCYLMAPLAEIALQDPQAIQNAIIDNGDGTYTIGFNMAPAGAPAQWDYVTVNTMFPAYYQTDENGNPTGDPMFAYANGGQDMTNSNNVLWVPLYEKAYAQLAEEGWSRGPGAANSYDSIGGGDAGVTMQQLAAVNVQGENIGPDTADDIYQQVTVGQASGEWVCLGTPYVEPNPDLTAGHFYALIGYDGNSGLFTVYNPYGFTQQLSWNDMQTGFNWYEFTV